MTGQELPLAVVTGAAGGIGHEVVRALSKEYEVIGHDTVQASGVTLTSDLTTPAGVAELLDAVGHRPLGTLVLAHGLGGTGALPGLSEARVHKVMDVNFHAVVDIVEKLAPALRQGGGAAVVVASQAGLVGEAEHAAYSASKFAVVGWARAIAPQLYQSGVRLRLMCPGCVDTSMFRNAISNWATDRGLDPEKVLNERIDGIPIGRLAGTDEIAAGIRYLVSLPSPSLVVLNESGGETFVR